jgi:thiol:disulfide interchange protein DsbD
MVGWQIDFDQITFLTFILVYLAGVLTSLTPCLYPVIPVTIGFIGARSAGSRWRGLLLSIFYVLGLSVVYAGLGMMAVLTGRFFGEISSHPLTMILIANLYILLALAMLGVFDPTVHLPGEEALREKVMRRERNDLLKSFLVGAASALAVGPCTAPVLGALLIWTAGGQNVILGTSLMFIFSLGLGTLLILVGTFSGLLSSLPRSGAWLKVIKVFFALLLFAAAEYFLIQAGKMLF